MCCNPHKSKFRPRRLIDTESCGAAGVVKLDTDTLIDDLPYATLSYCWGGDQEGKTLRANLPSRLQGFNLKDQPKTIQDAVTMTRALGIRFVWVDSLCIVQDDNDDKVHEITRMHDIYRFSYLTISAARASSSQEGFLNHCKPVDPIRLAYRGPDGTLGSIILSSCRMVREPIHSRAWTLQEHTLSTRLLIFGTFGMRWVCRSGKCSDGEQENTHHFRNKLAEHLHIPAESGSSLVGEWHDLVVGYSSRGLTNVDDRLPAISAMATMHSAARKDSRYLAGLWSDSLPRDLLWNLFSTVNWAGGHCDQQPGFPSWSWASVRGPIAGFTPKENVDVVTLSVINSHVTLQNATAPFGQVKSGKLIVEGLLFVVRRSFHHEMEFVNSHGRLPGAYQEAVVHAQSCRSLLDENTGEIAVFQAGMDYPTKIKSLEGYYCLEVMSDTNNPRTSKGLLLKPINTTSSERLFMRVGQYTPTTPKDTASVESWAQKFKVAIV